MVAHKAILTENKSRISANCYPAIRNTGGCRKSTSRLRLSEITRDNKSRPRNILEISNIIAFQCITYRYHFFFNRDLYSNIRQRLRK